MRELLDDNVKSRRHRIWLAIRPEQPHQFRACATREAARTVAKVQNDQRRVMSLDVRKQGWVVRAAIVTL